MPGDAVTTSPDAAKGIPDWMAAFGSAVVRLATFVEDQGVPPRLAFASVELLAPDRPPPVSGSVQRSKAPSLGRKASVFFRRTAMTAGSALAWYVEAAAGRLVTPLPLDSVQGDATTDGLPIAATPLVHEPEWPELALPLDRDTILDTEGGGSYAPFVGAGAEPARINRLIAEPDPALDALLADPVANLFLRRRLHVDLALYPEYRGGVALYAPDPVVRSVQMFVRPRKERGEREEDLVVRVDARDGAALDGLALSVSEVRGGSLASFETVEVPLDGLMAFPRRQGTAMAGYVLVHRHRGVIRHQSPVPFLRRIHIGSHVLARRVSVEAPTTESPKATTETYATEEHSADRPKVIGEAARGDGISRILAAEATRRRLAAGERQGQRWLGDAGEARVLVRKILAQASRRVWLVDPYLGGNQVFQYLHAMGTLSIEVRLLTSRLAFQSEAAPDDPDAVPGEGERERLARFEHGVRSLRDRGFPDVRASVLRGRIPRLHDRFLVVDGEVWFAGTSLNALGARAGLILKVPDPVAVIARLKELLDGAMPFDAFLKERVDVAVAGDGRSA